MNINFSQQVQSDYQDIELRKHLLEKLNTEKVQFNQLMENFHAQPNQSDQPDYGDEYHLKLCREIIALVDRLVAAGDWESSLFLRNTIQPFKKMRDDALLALENSEQTLSVDSFEEVKLGEDTVEVYVSLYQADGMDMAKWELQLKTLSRYVVGRPVYAEEASVQKAIRLRNNKPQEAYVVVGVNQGDILPSLVAAPQDRQGSTLLCLSEGAIRAKNIVKFTHQNKQYRLVENKLKLVV